MLIEQPFPKNTKILILGGTQEARELATALVEAGYDPISALKGATNYRLPVSGRTRIGGFSSAEKSSEQGLRDYLQDQNIDLLIDATHPFAAIISPRAQSICVQINVPYVRLEREPWQPQKNDKWQQVQTLDEALKLVPTNAKIFAAIGRQKLETLGERLDCKFIARAIEQPSSVPKNVHIILDRPPFNEEGEYNLMKTHQITHLISKNAGGSQTIAKLNAARKLGVNLIMIDRPKNQPKQDYSNVNLLMKGLFNS